MTMQKSTGGGVLKLSGGTLMRECCCGGASSCPDGDPEIRITLSDPDYAGGNITWCGETWTPAQIQTGTDTRTICPTFWQNDRAGSATGNYNFTNIWRYASSLMLTHDGQFTPTFFASIRRKFLVFSDGSVKRDRIQGIANGAFPTNITSSDLGLLNTTNAPSFSNNEITDDYFGSYISGGVTYTWARGNGW